jgi:hypothetical protein
VAFADGTVHTFQLCAGEQTAEGVYGPEVAHAMAPVGGHYWPGQPEGNDYVARVRWQAPSAPLGITVRATLPEGELVVRGISLIDERTGGFQALVLSDRGRFRLVHSGDVKIYENLDVLPRAFLVHRVLAAADDETAVALMVNEAFDPAAEIVLNSAEPTWAQPARGGESVRVVRYAAERVEVELTAAAPGYLVLADAWYPGWEALMDGEPVAIRRADVLFRAVAVETGVHHVVFTYRPASLRFGVWLSLAAAVVLLVLPLFGRVR